MSLKKECLALWKKKKLEKWASRAIEVLQEQTTYRRKSLALGVWQPELVDPVRYLRRERYRDKPSPLPRKRADDTGDSRLLRERIAVSAREFHRTRGCTWQTARQMAERYHEGRG